ncbi:MAG: sulfurtransferase TusC [Candidatus Lambdaproteobacteria bacterium RIFOXYD1_FULL_56_27]|uniref:Sulfurtransferase TusC n=1 Tax=Candidatus Lambdaproteobacteria bacterium RIFOXYD2_FULL_56_26 TaxID=1817773 RepID=A0A1F6GTS8_9PROT|nr:MAG: sulfurtransferase TusC [Candidatus Lambdaproteobacteria bacterium RIFOXYC1_FULL_56_13]OGH01547.1 MAG: sulfurtransferase TusC [Candidatus Lambdaproteobacteria bacterium RIFOXYD2_FULL_56_26]OGH06768.1 MAG: sulfurtransferase TusC [Candidatus Lambdaproteobacteria bacterium RIFOXYD1_FULL_56_27]
MGEEIKKIMHVVRTAPHGTIYPYEGLEMVLIMAAYEQEISMTFIGDGVYCLKKDQDTSKLAIKGFMKTLGVLEDYDVEKLFVDRISLEERGLTEEDLYVAVEVLESPAIGKLMAQQDVIIPH